MNKQTQDYIRVHRDADVRQLALKGAPDNVDLAFALDQISGRQKSRVKLPSWASVEGILYPPHLSMEQCSSEATARYKALLADRLLSRIGDSQRSMVDLTGGFGVDFSFLAAGFEEAVYVERQEHLCDIARSNFARLGLGQARVVCGDAADYLAAMDPVSLIFVDPARRDARGGRTFAIADCTPNVAALGRQLMDKARLVVVKLSPMLDWRKAVADMGEGVGEVHIVSVDGECKELVIVMSEAFHGVERLYCVNGDDVLECGLTESWPQTMGAPVSIDLLSHDGMWLYEPNASVMKAGCFGWVERHFGVAQIDGNSHLFVSDHEVRDFPGRRFQIERVTTMNKKALRCAMADIVQANITVRNFPVSVAELRRRLKISEGGSKYIFATTLTDKTHLLLICRK